jgi:hypothetical protein
VAGGFFFRLGWAHVSTGALSLRMAPALRQSRRPWCGGMLLGELPISPFRQQKHMKMGYKSTITHISAQNWEAVRGFLVECQRSPNAHKYGLVPLILCVFGRAMHQVAWWWLIHLYNYQLPCDCLILLRYLLWALGTIQRNCGAPSVAINHHHLVPGAVSLCVFFRVSDGHWPISES